MKYTTAVILGFSIAIAAIIGLIRFKKINPAYYPFLYCVWIALVNEAVSYMLVRMGKTTTVNNNIYVLAESLLYTWQFKNWGVFQRSRHLFTAIVVSFILFWIAEVFFLHRLIYNTSYFRIFYSFVIVLMSVSTINDNLIRERGNMLKNPIFLICSAFVIYFTYNVIVKVFWLYGLGNSKQFRIHVIVIHIYINLFANLIYALAILWMPKRLRFSPPS